jgi:nitroimidazol reductase NimA-like FMN-containing flavoprotein (pyridoxamine 5'-phosphate oxidase superfamily)
VDEVKDDAHWRSVLAFGLYEEIEDARERGRVLADMFERWPHTTEVESQTKNAAPETIVFCIRVTDITGVYENH